MKKKKRKINNENIDTNNNLDLKILNSDQKLEKKIKELEKN